MVCCYFMFKNKFVLVVVYYIIFLFCFFFLLIDEDEIDVVSVIGGKIEKKIISLELDIICEVGGVLNVLLRKFWLRKNNSELLE